MGTVLNLIIKNNEEDFDSLICFRDGCPNTFLKEIKSFVNNNQFSNCNDFLFKLKNHFSLKLGIELHRKSNYEDSEDLSSDYTFTLILKNNKVTSIIQNK